jgi:hypothetical protein|tara:strand:+ start:6910 stop:7092 length:183 start_codon:yes stop_codon:yes gene_type:complete
MSSYKKPAPTPSNIINKMAGTYDYAELRPFTGREGAMDAFKMPSLIGDKLVYRRDAGEIK